MKNLLPLIFTLALFSTPLYAQILGQSVVQPRVNNYPCSPSAMLEEHNKIRADPTYLANAIKTRYPTPAAADEQWVNRALDYLGNASNFNDNTKRPLTLATALSQAAGLQVHTEAYYQNFGARGCNGTSSTERVLQFAYADGVGELLWAQQCTQGYCRSTCLDILMDLVINKNSQNPSNRQIIFSPDYKYLGYSTGGKNTNGTDRIYLSLTYATTYNGPKQYAVGKEDWANFFLQNFSCPDNGQWQVRVSPCPNLGGTQACQRNDFITALNQLRKDPTAFAATIEEKYNTQCFGSDTERQNALTWLRGKTAQTNNLTNQGYLNYVASYQAHVLNTFNSTATAQDNAEAFYYGCGGADAQQRIVQGATSWNRSDFIGEIVYHWVGGTQERQLSCEELLVKYVVGEGNCKDHREALLDPRLVDVGLGISEGFYVAEFTRSTPRVFWYDTNVLRYNQRYVCPAGVTFGLTATQKSRLRTCPEPEGNTTTTPTTGNTTTTTPGNTTGTTTNSTTELPTGTGTTIPPVTLPGTETPATGTETPTTTPATNPEPTGTPADIPISFDDPNVDVTAPTPTTPPTDVPPAGDDETAEITEEPVGAIGADAGELGWPFFGDVTETGETNGAVESGEGTPVVTTPTTGTPTTGTPTTGTPATNTTANTTDPCTTVQIRVYSNEWLPNRTISNIDYKQVVFRLKAVRAKPQCYIDDLEAFAETNANVKNTLNTTTQLINSQTSFPTIYADQGLFRLIEARLAEGDIRWQYPFGNLVSVAVTFKAVYINKADLTLSRITAELADIYYNGYAALFSYNGAFSYVGFGLREVPNTDTVLLMAAFSSRPHM